MELRLCNGQDTVQGLARGQDSAVCAATAWHATAAQARDHAAGQQPRPVCAARRPALIRTSPRALCCRNSSLLWGLHKCCRGLQTHVRSPSAVDLSPSEKSEQLEGNMNRSSSIYAVDFARYCGCILRGRILLDAKPDHSGCQRRRRRRSGSGAARSGARSSRRKPGRAVGTFLYHASSASRPGRRCARTRRSGLLRAAHGHGRPAAAAAA